MKKTISIIMVAIVMISCCSMSAGAKSKGYWWSNKYQNVLFDCNFNTTWKSAVSNAMTTWNNVKQAGTGNTIVPMGFTSDGNSSMNNIISSNAIANWIALTTTEANGTTSIVWTEICFNTKYSYAFGAVSGSYDVQSIAAHELGHTIGIAHCHEIGTTCSSSTCSINTMNPYANTNSTSWRTLESYDIQSKQAIYA